MDSEESYNPYHSLHKAPQANQWPPDDTESTVGAVTIESPPIIKRRRAWVLLVIPAMLLFSILVLLCFMLQWLLHHRADFDLSFGNMTFGNMTKDALIVDEAAQWCQLLTIVNHDPCNKVKQAQNLLGLTLSSLLVSHPICQ